MLTKIQELLQSFMDMCDSGTVNLWECDGIPGNCTLWPLDRRVISVTRSLRGDTRVRRQARFNLLYLDTTPHGEWVDEFDSWCQDQYAQFYEGLRVWVERTGCKQNSDGTFAITACITAEFETLSRGVDQ